MIDYTGQQIGTYLLQALIGSGTFRSVYLPHPDGLKERSVAVKLLASSLPSLHAGTGTVCARSRGAYIPAPSSHSPAAWEWLLHRSSPPVPGHGVCPRRVAAVSAHLRYSSSLATSTSPCSLDADRAGTRLSASTANYSWKCETGEHLVYRWGRGSPDRLLDGSIPGVSAFLLVRRPNLPTWTATTTGTVTVNGGEKSGSVNALMNTNQQTSGTVRVAGKWMCSTLQHL
jgi:hypothetical protein